MDSRTGTCPIESEKKKNGYAVVIERYSRPNITYPAGRLEVIAGDKLLYEGDLPFLVGINGEADLPFVRQRSLPRAANFSEPAPSSGQFRFSARTTRLKIASTNF